MISSVSVVNAWVIQHGHIDFEEIAGGAVTNQRLSVSFFTGRPGYNLINLFRLKLHSVGCCDKEQVQVLFHNCEQPKNS